MKKKAIILTAIVLITSYTLHSMELPPDFGQGKKQQEKKEEVFIEPFIELTNPENRLQFRTRLSKLIQSSSYDASGDILVTRIEKELIQSLGSLGSESVPYANFTDFWRAQSYHLKGEAKAARDYARILAEKMIKKPANDELKILTQLRTTNKIVELLKKWDKTKW